MRPITSLAQKFHLDDTHDSKRYRIEELNWATSWEQGRWLGGGVGLVGNGAFIQATRGFTHWPLNN